MSGIKRSFANSMDEMLEREARDKVARQDLDVQRQLEEVERLEKENRKKRMLLDTQQRVAATKAELLSKKLVDTQLDQANLLYQESELEKGALNIPVEVARLRALQKGIPYVPPAPPVVSAAGGAAGGSVSGATSTRPRGILRVGFQGVPRGSATPVTPAVPGPSASASGASPSTGDGAAASASSTATVGTTSPLDVSFRTLLGVEVSRVLDAMVLLFD